MTMVAPSSLVFKVERSQPELVPPAKPTPYEIKELSDIDDQKDLRVQIPLMHIYRNAGGVQGKDPAKVIKEAISQVLVHYYPLAGRLRESGSDHKLVVECTGEGIMFIEADAYVSLDQFGDVLLPPFPCAEDLLYDVPGSNGILHCPLLLIQVTRLACGGFILAHRMNHTMMGGFGFVQYLNALAEMARGALVPSIKPIWNRELLMARDPPRKTCVHHLYEASHQNENLMVCMDDMVDNSFFFTLKEIAILKNLLPPHLRRCTKYEILAACIWRCRTVALNCNSKDKIRFICVVDASTKLNPPLPVGTYGNAFILQAALTTVGELCQNPLAYALELISKAKDDVTEEFVKSAIDAIVIHGRPSYANISTFEVSNIVSLGFITRDIDIGWGQATFGGTIGFTFGECDFQLSRNEKGEDGIFAIVRLPRSVMERFVVEIEKLIKEAKIVYLQ